MPGRYFSREKFGPSGGQVLKNNNNDGRRKSSTRKTL